MGNQELVLAHWATEQVIASFARDVPEGRLTAPFDPAAGTKKTIPALNRKIRKALWSEARRIAFRLCLRYLLLSLRKTALNIRQASLNARRYFLRCLSNAVVDGHSLPQSRLSERCIYAN
jgi:hypothetical protein